MMSELEESNHSPGNPRVVIRMMPPVLKRAVADAFNEGRVGGALESSMHDLEKLLMINSDAPSLLDGIPLAPTVDRSLILVNVVQKTYASSPTPELAAMIRQVGPSLKADRVQRGAVGTNAPDIVESVQQITRTVVYTKPSYPRY